MCLTDLIIDLNFKIYEYNIICICFLEYSNPEKKCCVYMLKYVLTVYKKGGKCDGERNTQERWYKDVELILFSFQHWGEREYY